MSVCSLCQRTDLSSLNCTCGKVAYCGQECQRLDWDRHKTDCPLLVVRPVEGKGMGLFTTRKVKAGRMLLKEKPLLLMEYEDEEDQKDKYMPMTTIEAEFNKLSVEDKNKIYGLRSLEGPVASMKDVHDQNSIKLGNIIGANAYEIKYQNGEVKMAVYEKHMRINHSCKPNVSKASWSSWTSGEPGAGDILVVKALQDLPKNTELLNNYLDDQLRVFKTRTERRTELMRDWGFLCKCEVCSLTGKDLENNELIRRKLKENSKLMIQSVELSYKRIKTLDDFMKDYEVLAEMLDLMEKIQPEETFKVPGVLSKIAEISDFIVLHGGKVPMHNSGYYRENSRKMKQLLFG